MVDKVSKKISASLTLNFLVQFKAFNKILYFKSTQLAYYETLIVQYAGNLTYKRWCKGF